MKHMLLLLALSSLLTVARADRRDDDRDRRREEPRVILFRDADFRGDSLVLYPGDVIDNFSGRTFANGNALNDSVSSIRVEGGAEVSAFENARFRGQELHLNESVRDLTSRRLRDDRRDNWNDRISSIRVEGFRHRDGERVRDLDGVIRRTFLDLLGRQPDDRAVRLYRGEITDRNWTDQMVRDRIRHGEEFRHEVADRIVRRAYEELLKREPDEQGLRDYSKAIIEQEWTENTVRESIRHSDEYRQITKKH